MEATLSAGPLLHDLMLHAEQFSSRQLAVVDGSIRNSYGEVGTRVRRAAAGLSRLGLAPGQHVAILAENGSFFYEAYFACSFAGLVAVPVNVRLTAAEVGFILNDGDCRAILFDDACARLLDAADRRLKVCSSDRIEAVNVHWEQLVSGNDPLEVAPAGGGEDSLAHLCYTGGTTGRPKGVMLSHRNIVASAMNKIMLGGFMRDDVWLHAAPMFHQADSWACFAFTALGASHVFMPRFNARSAVDLIAAHEVSSVQLVPTMIVMMLETAEVAARDLSSIRRILYGSAPMPVELLRRCKEVFGSDVMQHIYGLTEAAGTVAATPWPPQPKEATGERLASCGQPIVGVNMRIVDDRARALPAGSVGHIQVRGANVMLGYWRRPDETKQTFVDGWLDTGDIGRMDAEGFVYIVDRAKDVVISGGENVYSTEVENVLHELPSIRDVAVIGLPHPRWGEAVTAVVVPRPGHEVTVDEVVSHCRQRLAAYKCPKNVIFRAVLPKSAAGKTLKVSLREECIRERDNLHIQ